MISALIGDILGSRFEAAGNRDPGVALKHPHCTFTDDTVCSLAVAQWLIETNGQGHPGQALRLFANHHRERGFAPGMLAWLLKDADTVQASFGNGSAMRVAPTAWWADNSEHAQALALRSTHPTHVHPESETAAQATAWAIWHAFTHRDPARLLADASARWPYGDLAARDLDAERPDHVFDLTARGTVPLSIIMAARGGSYEGTARLAVSMNGDSDTLAAIALPIAEGLYGLDEDLAQWSLRRQELWFDPHLWPTLLAFQEHPRVLAFYARHGRTPPDVAGWWAQGPQH